MLNDDYISLVDRAAILVRSGEDTGNIGHEEVKVDDGASVVYNLHDRHGLTCPLFYDVCVEHAKTHDGKILIPFGAYVNDANLANCSKFILLDFYNRWLMGEIVDAGRPFDVDEVNVAEPYLIPADLHIREAKCWVRLKNVTYGDDFDRTRWLTRTWRDGRQVLLSESHGRRAAAQVVYRLLDENGRW